MSIDRLEVLSSCVCVFFVFLFISLTGNVLGPIVWHSHEEFVFLRQV